MANDRSSQIIKKDCATPIYVQVMEYLRGNISSGTWHESDKIPSEAELTELLGVSRGSVKKAISKLVESGELEQIQGKGTYVKSRGISFPLAEGLISFSETLKEQGIDFTTKIVSSKEKKCEGDVAKALNLPRNTPYLQLERVRYVKGEPIMYIENNINSMLTPGIDGADFVRDSLFSILEGLTGHRVTHSKTTFIAVAADAQRAEYLDVEPKTPLLQQVQTVYLDNGSAIEHARVWLKSNRFSLGTVFQRRR